MQRSKNVQKIEYALDELGFVVTSIVWEPWGGSNGDAGN